MSNVAAVFFLKVSDNRKRLEESANVEEAFEEMKKKMARDTELLQQKVDMLTNENDKLTKSKRKLQSEVSYFVIKQKEIFVTQINWTFAICWRIILLHSRV